MNNKKILTISLAVILLISVAITASNYVREANKRKAFFTLANFLAEGRNLSKEQFISSAQSVGKVVKQDYPFSISLNRSRAFISVASGQKAYECTVDTLDLLDAIGDPDISDEELWNMFENWVDDDCADSDTYQ